MLVSKIWTHDLFNTIQLLCLFFFFDKTQPLFPSPNRCVHLERKRKRKREVEKRKAIDMIDNIMWQKENNKKMRDITYINKLAS